MSQVCRVPFFGGSKSSAILHEESPETEFEPWLTTEEREEEKLQTGAKLELIDDEPKPPASSSSSLPVVAGPIEEDLRVFLVEEPPRITKPGMEAVEFAPRPYRVDTLHPEVEHEEIRALLKEMNTSGDGWNVVYEPEGASAPRFYTHWPGEMPYWFDKDGNKTHAPSEHNVRHLRLAYDLGSELLSPAALYDKDKRVLRLSLGPAAIPDGVKSHFAAFETRAFHLVPLRVRLLEASNGSPTTFQAGLQTTNLRGGHTTFAQAQVVGAGDVRSTTLPSRTHGYTPRDELARMFEFKKVEADKYNHPETQRWMLVDPSKVLAHAETLRYEGGPNMCIRKFDDPLFPDSLVECVLFSYGHVLRRASELVEEERVKQAAQSYLTDEQRTLVSKPIRVPYKRPLGRDGKEECWVINFRAFELALAWLCSEGHSTHAINLRAPTCLELTPRDGINGWYAFSQDVRPASLSAILQIDWVEFPSSSLHTTPEQEKHITKANREHRTHMAHLAKLVKHARSKFRV